MANDINVVHLSMRVAVVNCLIGQKPPLKLQPVWVIRIRLKLRQSLRDVVNGDRMLHRTLSLQQRRSVQFETSPPTRALPAPVYPSIRTLGWLIGSLARARPVDLQDAFTTALQSDLDLQEVPELAGRSTYSRTFKDREHREVRRGRGRGRSGIGRGHGGLSTCRSWAEAPAAFTETARVVFER